MFSSARELSDDHTLWGKKWPVPTSWQGSWGWQMSSWLSTEQGAGMPSPQSLGQILRHWHLQAPKTKADKKSISLQSPCKLWWWSCTQSVCGSHITVICVPLDAQFMESSLSYLRETLWYTKHREHQPWGSQDSHCSLCVHLCQGSRTTMKWHPGPAAPGTQSMNLALHSEKQISISATSSLVNFFLCLPPSLCFCFLHGWGSTQ